MVAADGTIKTIWATRLLPNQAEKEALGNSVDAVHVYHVFAEPDLGEHVFAVRELADRDLADSELTLIPILGGLKDMGFSGVLSLELFNAEYYRQDPLQVARTGLEKLKAVVEEALG